MILVVSQPMFIPWIGIFEQIRIADVYIHYDDVQMPQGGSFMSRVQVKTPDGIAWLTIPVSRPSSKSKIYNVKLVEGNWRRKHQRLLSNIYKKSPYVDDTMDLIHEIYSNETDLLADFNINAIEIIARYFGLQTTFFRSRDYPTTAVSTGHLLHLSNSFSADIYVTGHGAVKYMDHELFEDNSVKVEYMDYKRLPYPQLFGTFDPHVSILDVVANCGPSGVDLMCSDTINWRKFTDA